MKIKFGVADDKITEYRKDDEHLGDTVQKNGKTYRHEKNEIKKYTFKERVFKFFGLLKTLIKDGPGEKFKDKWNVVFSGKRKVSIYYKMDSSDANLKNVEVEPQVSIIKPEATTISKQKEIPETKKDTSELEPPLSSNHNKQEASTISKQKEIPETKKDTSELEPPLSSNHNKQEAVTLSEKEKYQKATTSISELAPSLISHCEKDVLSVTFPNTSDSKYNLSAEGIENDLVSKDLSSEIDEIFYDEDGNIVDYEDDMEIDSEQEAIEFQERMDKEFGYDKDPFKGGKNARIDIYQLLIYDIWDLEEFIKRIDDYVDSDKKSDSDRLLNNQPAGLTIVSLLKRYGMAVNDESIEDLIKNAEAIRKDDINITSKALGLQLVLGKLLLENSTDEFKFYEIDSYQKVDGRNFRAVRCQEVLIKKIGQKKLGSAVDNGNCFYDSFLQGLPEDIKKENTIGSLKMEIVKYLKSIIDRKKAIDEVFDKGDEEKSAQLKEEWQLIEEELKRYKKTLSHDIEHTSLDKFINQLNKEIEDENLTPKWGNEALHGVILCRIFKVNLEIHTVKPKEFQIKVPDGRKDKYIDLDPICLNYKNTINYNFSRYPREYDGGAVVFENTIEIALYPHHYVPVEKK